MKFHADHVIDGISLEAYGELYFDEAFNVALCQAIALDRTTLRFERDGTRILREVDVSPRGRELPAPVAKVIGTNRFSYVEHLEVDLATHEGRWTIRPAIFSDKVKAFGTLRFVDRDGTARRVVDGTVEVSVFGIGSIVERFICADAEKSYADAAEFTRRWVREHR